MSNDENILYCAYCGKIIEEDWAHVEGDSNRGVLKIEHFCCEKHKMNFLESDFGS